MNPSLLDITDLTVRFHTPEGVATAVDGVNLTIAAGETVGLVGESGCGKSVTALAVMGLIATPPGDVTGRIRLDGTDLNGLPDDRMQRVRGRDVAMIFQEPMTSLNPVLPIGRQVAEPLMVHRGLSRRAAWDEAGVWLEHVRIPGARRRLNDYPHQLSGGMRQRVMIAMAMVCRPRLLIADEPTTALDVSIQSQILRLMHDLKQELGMAMLLITHDLGVVAQMAGRVVVMYAGQVVETAPVAAVFDRPFHPYTRGLLRSIPRLDARAGGCRRLNEIAGSVPALTDVIPGCRFAPRCASAFDLCRTQRPRSTAVAADHAARCWLTAHPERRCDP